MIIPWTADTRQKCGTRKCLPWQLSFPFCLVLCWSVACSAERRPPLADSPAMSRARSQLIVVPVFTDVRSSGFPVTKRNVICSSHALRDFTVAAVAGFPLTVLPFTHRAASVKPVTDTDWEVLFAPYDRFTPNIIDPTAELQPGLPVLLAGYPHDQNPNATAAEIGRAHV